MNFVLLLILFNLLEILMRTVTIAILCFITCLLSFIGSSGGVVVKLLACGARGSGFNSRSCRYNFRDWLSPASKSRYG